MSLEKLEQGTDAWLRARVGMITGSRVGAILGMSPFSKPADVMREMVREYHGAEREFKGNIATEYGNDNEDRAISAFEDLAGCFVESTGFHKHADHEWLGASPDGFVHAGGKKSVLEVKCPFGKRNGGEFKPIYEQPHYWAQMQIEMACTGLDHCEFVQWNPADGIGHVPVEFDAAWFDENLPALKAFHDEYLEVINSEELSAPHLEALEVERDDDEWSAAVDRYKLADAAAKQAKTEADAAKKALVELSMGRKSRGFGALVYPVKKDGSISYSKAVKELIPTADLEKYRGKSSESWAVKIS